MKADLRSLNPHTFLCIAVLLVAGLAVGATLRSEDGTPEEQEKVRVSRDISVLPLKSRCSVRPEKELFITNLSVVEDCHRTKWTGACPAPSLPATLGAWTFGRLAEGIFGTTDPVVLSDQVKGWLDQAALPNNVNGQATQARAEFASLKASWPRLPGTDHLDMQKAPMRLLAIVARLDLRQNAAYSGGASAGEGRFVFGVLGSNGSTREFLVILEYGLDAVDCADIQDWAQAWHALGAIPFGPDYNAALQEVTDRFAAIGASPGKPNGSALNQIRTNEINLANPIGQPWELREFRLPAGTSGIAPLVLTTVAQTPANQHQNQQILADYVNANANDIVDNNYVVPLLFGNPLQPFRAAASQNPSNNFNWDGPPPACTSILNHDARHVFSLNTCNGCHGGETDTIFKHVEPRSPGSPSQLSAFLTGMATVDMCARPRQFGDIERRRVDLCQLLAKTCPQIDSEPAVTFVH